MDLIARIYTEYQDYLRSNNHHHPSEGLTNDKIKFSMMLEIAKHVNNKKYADLHKIRHLIQNGLRDTRKTVHISTKQSTTSTSTSTQRIILVRD